MVALFVVEVVVAAAVVVAAVVAAVGLVLALVPDEKLSLQRCLEASG